MVFRPYSNNHGMFFRSTKDRTTDGDGTCKLFNKQFRISVWKRRKGHESFLEFFIWRGTVTFRGVAQLKVPREWAGVITDTDNPKVQFIVRVYSRQGMNGNSYFETYFAPVKREAKGFL